VTDRREVLQTLTAQIYRSPAGKVVRVAIDGVDGAGKTHLADELAPLLSACGRTTIRASVDGFHNPRALRYRKGRDSPEGFFQDSYDYDQLKAVLLDPLSPAGTGRYRVAMFDHRSDQPVQHPEQVASPGAILLLDGIFLHRPELRAYWDYSIFLQVAFRVSIPRGAQRGEGSPDPMSSANARYIRGQELYLSTCDPMSWATVVVNNDDLASPYFVETKSALEDCELPVGDAAQQLAD
jgi:uridine kinase